MNNDLISRSALLGSAYMTGMWNRKTQQFDLCVVDFEDVQDAPAVDAEPVRHGRWEKKKDCLTRCSECHQVKPYDAMGDDVIYWPCGYCPNCGCKMDGDKNG